MPESQNDRFTQSRGVTDVAQQAARMTCPVQVALKCADLGHAAAEWPVHQHRVALLQEAQINLFQV